MHPGQRNQQAPSQDPNKAPGPNTRIRTSTSTRPLSHSTARSDPQLSTKSDSDGPRKLARRSTGPAIPEYTHLSSQGFLVLVCGDVLEAQLERAGTGPPHARAPHERPSQPLTTGTPVAVCRDSEPEIPTQSQPPLTRGLPLARPGPGPARPSSVQRP
jgi:hypothetical protein